MTMTNQVRTLLLDSDVLISAYRDRYAPDYCPGFWDCLAHYFSNGRILIIDPVRTEIFEPPALVQWISQLPQQAFASVDVDVAQAYTRVGNWVQTNSQFNAAARNSFAGAADGWLAAYGIEHNAIVITNEESAPDSKSTVKLPDLCKRFQVKCGNTQYLLRELNVRLDWRGP